MLIIAAILTLGFFVMRRRGADSHLALRRLGFLIFAVAAILAVLFPQWLTWFANLIGVGRGADLLLYALVIVFLAVVFTQFRRNVTLQRELTVLARRIALLEAREAERAVEDPRSRSTDVSVAAEPTSTERTDTRPDTDPPA